MTRILWLFGFIFFLFCFFHWKIPSYQLILSHSEELYFALLGIIAADISHLILD
jgi:hypothetical protein